MNNYEPIIDVNPVASTSGAAANTGAFQAPSFGKKTTEFESNVTKATVMGADSAKKTKKPNRVGGIVQAAIGGAIMLVGVPMLILPGPGLLAVGGGAALAGGGIKKILGR